MEILYILLPLSLLLGGIGVAGYYWCVRSGQMDDLDTPALRMLIEADPVEPAPAEPNSSKTPKPPSNGAAH